MPASSCKDKAQTDARQGFRGPGGDGRERFRRASSKPLSTALKDTLKGQSLVALAQSCKGSSGGGGVAAAVRTP